MTTFTKEQIEYLDGFFKEKKSSMMDFINDNGDSDDGFNIQDIEEKLNEFNTDMFRITETPKKSKSKGKSKPKSKKSTYVEDSDDDSSNSSSTEKEKPKKKKKAASKPKKTSGYSLFMWGTKNDDDSEEMKIGKVNFIKQNESFDEDLKKSKIHTESVARAGKFWANMSDDEKEVFKQKAETLNEQLSEN